MSPDIDFTELSIRDTLDLAIAIEEEAKERYDEFSAQLEAHHTPEVAKFFRFMSANEVKHAELLAAERSRLFGSEASTADTSVVIEVEAPSYEGARAFMSIQEALDVALAAEVKAYEFYRDALEQVEDESMKELFIKLRDEEVRHQEMIKEIMAKVPDLDTFDPEDFVDEPTAQ
ncbi:MAG: ferritin family protein [Holophagae bacterium]|jgi:rubrerythrin